MEKEKLQENKKLIVQAIIEKIEEEEGDSTIKTDVVEGYHKPEKIVRKENNDNGFVPDVISEKENQTDVYEIEMEDDIVLEKWRLFSGYTNKTNGEFNIVTPKNNLDLVKDMLKDNKIKAKILYFA